MHLRHPFKRFSRVFSTFGFPLQGSSRLQRKMPGAHYARASSVAQWKTSTVSWNGGRRQSRSSFQSAGRLCRRA
ncbi:hypothetical protein HMPREF0762_00684 [Slackia exigua ATCC 700122]|uniref:Uncharacterized protein n=1 Tax=Slackia exigua (strain ATCC 700122 / DSM 15923 / CIP 105133 / JCM 11022 / KCTC 5966 / S-7) TaxID=649764 RepID=D0WFT4_SLAES|nr:hypothetical protein HMPREF0762_00684 [Slackia exigua ATCC 700122]